MVRNPERKVVSRKVLMNGRYVTIKVCPWCGCRLPESRITRGVCPNCGGRIYYNTKRRYPNGYMR